MPSPLLVEKVGIDARDTKSRGAWSREMEAVLVPDAAGVEADISARPIVVRHRSRRRRLDRHVRRYGRPCDQGEQSHKSCASEQEFFHGAPHPQ